MLPPTLIVVIGVPLASSVQLKFVAFTLAVVGAAGLGDAATAGEGDAIAGVGDAVETVGPTLALLVAGPGAQERQARSMHVVSINPQFLSIFVPPSSSLCSESCDLH